MVFVNGIKNQIPNSVDYASVHSWKNNIAEWWYQLFTLSSRHRHFGVRGPQKNIALAIIGIIIIQAYIVLYLEHL